MRLLISLLAFLGVATAQAAPTSSVQWGYDPSGGTDWRAVTNWAELPWNTVYTRLDPGQMSSFTTTFAAPSDKVTIFIRVWKKWATLGRELDVDLDSITLTGFK